MTARLKLLCHASTFATREGAFPNGEPLDPQAQDKLTRAPHAFRRVDQCRTSPALCARQTAEALRLDAGLDPVLRECDYGRWTGQTFEALQAQEPEAIAAWLRDPSVAPHGGESVLQVIQRAGAWLDRQMELPGKTIAVTHASFIRAAVVHAIDATPRSFWRLDVAPLTVVTLSGHAGRWTLAGIAPLRA